MPTGNWVCTNMSGIKGVGSIATKLPGTLTFTVTKCRLGPGRGARVGEHVVSTFTYWVGMAITDETCITIVSGIRASPSSARAASPSGSILVRFRFDPCRHGHRRSRSGIASIAFNFLREGSPQLRTWVARGRLVFIPECVGTVIKCDRMSDVEPVVSVSLGFDVGGPSGSCGSWIGSARVVG